MGNKIGHLTLFYKTIWFAFGANFLCPFFHRHSYMSIGVFSLFSLFTSLFCSIALLLLLRCQLLNYFCGEFAIVFIAFFSVIESITSYCNSFLSLDLIDTISSYCDSCLLQGHVDTASELPSYPKVKYVSDVCYLFLCHVYYLLPWH